MSIDPVLSDLEARREAQLAELLTFLRIPSISAVPERRADVRRAAGFVAEALASLGLSVELHETDGHPLVYAESARQPGRPTLLFYGHYDVQPAQKSDGWATEPFEPVVKAGAVYARGASDDKGQLFCHIKALEAYRRCGVAWPVNVKFIVEGEEECGGHGVYGFTEQNAAKLACDAVVVSDTSFYDARTPAMGYSLRGLSYMEVHVRGPKNDLHSGSYGGTVQNPANALCNIVAALKDGVGHVLVPGFYDDVLPLSHDERAGFRALNYADATLLAETGAPAPYGEEGYSTLERMWVRPTCDVNGMVSGYTGAGAKTIIPATATAKISMRLVPQQDPEKIARAFQDYVAQVAPPGVEVEVVNLHNAGPVRIPRDNAMVNAGLLALERGFGVRPVFIGEGGSIPIVATFQACLGAPVLLLGYGRPDDGIHSVNEKFNLEQFWGGIRTTAHLLQTVVS